LLSTCLLLLPPVAPLWILTVIVLCLIPLSLAACVVPLRALVVDKLPPSQRTMGFAMQSFFIGLGGIVAHTNAWPVSLLLSWQIGAIILLLFLVWTWFSVKEEPPVDLEESARTRERPPFKVNSTWTGAGALVGAIVGAAPSLLAEVALTASYPLVGALFGGIIGAVLGGPEISSALREMPRTMKQLAIVQLLTWAGFSCLWMFFARATAQQIYRVSDPQQPAFAHGLEFGHETLTWYSVACCALALVLPLAARFTSRRMVHSLALLIGGACLLATGYIHDQVLWQCTMIGVGLAWASTMAMPYAILSTALPVNRVGTYMGLFQLFVIVPEIFAALALQPIAVQFFDDDPVKLVMLGGALLLAAAVATQFVGEGPLLTPEYQSVAAEEGILPGSAPAEAPQA
jgi:maltose/moltooligosaccharide transporter